MPARWRVLVLAGLVIAAVARAQPIDRLDRFEVGIDRPGSDISATHPSNSAQHCEALCRANAACVAFTWVRPGVAVQPPFEGHPVCWLKRAVPPPIAHDCCTSGVK